MARSVFFGLVCWLGVAGLTGSDDGRAALGGRSASTLGVTGLIAYTDPAGPIRAIRADGTGDRTISPPGDAYGWPTFSPDGRWIAYSSRTDRSETSAATLQLFLGASAGGPARVVLSNQLGAGPILPEVPHYVLWAPDGAHMAIIGNAPAGLSLFLYGTNADTPPRAILRTAPLYAAWSTDARWLLVHGGSRHFLVARGSDSAPRILPEDATRYRAPAWRAGSDQATFLSANAAGLETLVTRDLAAPGATRTLGTVPGTAAFLWSPDGRVLAVARGSEDGPAYDSISFRTLSGGRAMEAIPGPVLAFFWSPDASKLAYVVPGEGRGVVSWRVLDVGGGELRSLADFIPSRDQLTILRYFDQFAYSHSPWSPDGRALLFAGRLVTRDGADSMADSAADGLFVQAITAGAVPRRIASGAMGVWSPRPGPWVSNAATMEALTSSSSLLPAPVRRQEHAAGVDRNKIRSFGPYRAAAR